MSKINNGSKNTETTSARIATIASQALKNPGSITNKEIQSIAASVLTQTADKPKKS